MAVLDVPSNDAWFVAADGKPYGPYTEVQLKGFIGEGRVGATTPVMRTGERWALASEHASLAWIFSRSGPSAPAPVGAAPQPPIAEALPGSGPAPATPSAPVPMLNGAAAPADTEAAAAIAKVVIIAELRTGSTIAFENAVSKLGPSYRMNQFVWFVQTQLPIAQIRKELVPFAGRNDPIVIADTSHGRAAWINFGPGAEATIKALWSGKA